MIAAVRKLSYISDIAIDDVRLYNCSGRILFISIFVCVMRCTMYLMPWNQHIKIFQGDLFSVCSAFILMLEVPSNYLHQLVFQSIYSPFL